MKMNPYYDSDKLGLELLTFEEDLCYEFNILAFFKTPDGRIYTAQDSGCSCPTPFEDYEGETLDDVTQLLERIGSLSQAEQIFDSWNKDFDDKPLLPISHKNKLSDWIKASLK